MSRKKRKPKKLSKAERQTLRKNLPAFTEELKALVKRGASEEEIRALEVKHGITGNPKQ